VIPEVEVATRRWRDVTSELTSLVARVPQERWDGPSACGSWTNRDLLSHLATGYIARIEWLETAIAGRGAVKPRDIDAVNERNVAAWHLAPVEAIVAELVATRARVLHLLEQLEAGHLDAVFNREGRDTRLADLLTTFSVHDVDHAEQLAQASS
jgi:uncharacterized damage-inducible protein DinB